MPVKTQPCVRCGGTDTRLCLVRYRVIHRDGTSDYDPRHFLCAPCYQAIGDGMHVIDYQEPTIDPVKFEDWRRVPAGEPKRFTAREAFVFAVEVLAISAGLVALFWFLGSRR